MNYLFFFLIYFSSVIIQIVCSIKYYKKKKTDTKYILDQTRLRYFALLHIIQFISGIIPAITLTQNNAGITRFMKIFLYMLGIYVGVCPPAFINAIVLLYNDNKTKKQVLELNNGKKELP